MTTTIGSNNEQAAEILRKGGIVAIPTETVYGLAANALNAEAVTKIFEAKDRPFFDPLIVHASSIESIGQYVESIPDWAKALFEQFSPGPLTIVLRKSSIIPDIVTAGLPTVGIRIPAHPVALELLHRLDFPLAAPSANPFGYVSPTTAQHVADQLSERIPYILDGGGCSIGIESTIITEINSHPTILRFGGTPLEAIQAVIGSVEIQTSSSNPSAPGMLDSHYAPNQQVIIGTPPFDSKEFGWIRFFERYPNYTETAQIILSPGADLAEAAKNIFGALRSFDSTDISKLFIDLVPNSGLGRAINDRIHRAAAKK